MIANAQGVPFEVLEVFRIYQKYFKKRAFVETLGDMWYIGTETSSDIPRFACDKKTRKWSVWFDEYGHVKRYIPKKKLIETANQMAWKGKFHKKDFMKKKVIGKSDLSTGFVELKNVNPSSMPAKVRKAIKTSGLLKYLSSVEKQDTGEYLYLYFSKDVPMDSLTKLQSLIAVESMRFVPHKGMRVLLRQFGNLSPRKTLSRTIKEIVGCLLVHGHVALAKKVVLATTMWSRQSAEQFVAKITPLTVQYGFLPPEIVGSVSEEGSSSHDLDLVIRYAKDAHPDKKGLLQALKNTFQLELVWSKISPSVELRCDEGKIINIVNWKLGTTAMLNFEETAAVDKKGSKFFAHIGKNKKEFPSKEAAIGWVQDMAKSNHSIIRLFDLVDNASYIVDLHGRMEKSLT